MTNRRILVMRHAKSDWSRPGLQDFDRPLAPRGRRAAAAMGVYLLGEGLIPDLVLCSAARRAADTLSLIAQAAGMSPPVEMERGLYMAAADDLFERLHRIDDAVTRPMFIGHAPGFDAFARALAGNRRSADWRRMADKFPTAGLAVLDVSAAHWRDVGDGAADLERFVVPKDLL
jgi:phosphohistidine phosphatase